MSEWLAETYADHSSMQVAMARKVLDGLDLDDAARVLDVGCGDGKITAAIAGRVSRGSIVGVDPSHSMIAHASERHGPAHPNLRFEVGDARRLPFRGEFDVIVSFNALHWVPEHDDALRSIRAALRPGGGAHLRFACEGPRRSIEDVLEDVRESVDWASHFAGFRRPFWHPTPDEYPAMAGRAGFAVERLSVDDEAWDFGDRAGFEAFGRACFTAWTGRLPGPMRDRFIADVLDRFRSTMADGPGEANVFKFYQLNATLTAVGEAG